MATKYDYSAQYSKEINYIKLEIASLQERLPYKPSVITQINDLKRQIRERELFIAFA